MTDSPDFRPVPPSRLTRRALIGAGTAAGALACAAARTESAPRRARQDYPVLVGSSNALRGMALHYDRLLAGDDPLSVAIDVVKLVEADAEDMSVGLGGLPNEDGVVQLDAAVMHGPTHNSGAVACLEDIVHPSEVARLVMERTDHCLLVGEGARRFALQHGFEPTNLLTPAARARWLAWQEGLSEQDDRLPPSEAYPRRERSSSDGDEERPTGTIHCSALSTRGEVSCTTTTSGLAFKIPGRVGDSPIIGAGLYCDAEAGSAGATGRGEAAILANGSFAIVELLRQGAGPLEAGLEVLRRIDRQTRRMAAWQPALLNAEGVPSFHLHFYAVDLDGAFAGVTLRDAGRSFAVADPEKGPRLERLVALHA